MPNISTHYAAGLWLALTGTVFAPAVATADSDHPDADLEWEYCGPRPARLGPAVLPPSPGEDEPVSITADTFSYDLAEEVLTLRGDVELDQGTRKIRGDEMSYDVETEQLVATGQTFLSQSGVHLAGTKADVNLKSQQGRVDDVEYRFTGPINARGTAKSAELLDAQKTHYEDIIYTACRPGQTDWDLQARELVIDQDEGRGIARHAKLRIAEVPVLYTPYLSFPIDSRRKSGFLIPSIGSSNDSGFQLITPYYFNIAPNMDATLFPNFMSKRGLMLGGEFRILTPHHSAELYGEGIATDSQYQDDNARGAVRLLYRGDYGHGWSSFVNFNEVSDDEYLEDFGNRLELTSIRNIERKGNLNYAGDGWRSSLLLQEFQTVDSSILPEARPYARLPQLSLTIDPYRFGPGLEIGMDAEYDYFDHNAKVHGHRGAIQPYASWPIQRPYGHIIPRLNLYGATYSLEDQATDNPSNPTYAIPSFNLDGKLIFERVTGWLGHEALQTLEPRVYYLYTKFEDQDDIPVFDSSELTFSYSSLFRQNRFTGQDRIGDANQLTVGLTSRTLDTVTGRELFRASLGQIVYFRDRDVQIAGPSEDQGTSAIAAEISARLIPSLSGRMSFQWDPNRDEDQSEKRVLELHYETPEDRLVNLAYRFDLGTSEATRYEDVDLSMRWPVNPQIEVVGRWYYSLLNSQTTEAFAGIEYGRCCWRVRLLGRHFKNKPDTDGETSVMVQLELAGLGKFGHQIDKLLERGIYGYHAE